MIATDSLRSRLWAARMPLLAAGVALCVCLGNQLAFAIHHPLVCPFHALTGLWCPGCGSGRAVHALMRGNVIAAFHDNPLLVIALPYVLWTWFSWLLQTGTGTPLPGLPRKRWVAGTLFVVVLAFGIARNLPVFASTLLVP